MKKAINIYFIPSGDTKTKLDAIKNAGFDGVLLTLNDSHESMTFNESVNYCNKIGLEISMIHCHYYEPVLNSFWLEGEDGDELKNYYIKQIESIKDYGPTDFIIHTNGSKQVQNTKIGLNRLTEILKVCEKYNINLGIENLFSAEQLDYIFSNISHKNLKFCYDCGHENFLTPNLRLAKKHTNFLTSTHIHDNNGITDEHKHIGLGTIDLNKLAEDLSGCNFKFLTAEVKSKNENENINDYLKEAFNMLTALEKKIKDFRK